MNVLKMILGKIGAGILYGVGIGLIVALFAWGSSLYFESQNKEIMRGEYNNGECRNYKKCEDKSGLAVTITKERINSEEFIILGNVSNSGDIKWTSVKVKAELFDKGNNFIDECSEYIDQKVFPGQAINFKLSCTKCSKVNMDDYNSYKVSIIDGNTY